MLTDYDRLLYLVSSLLASHRVYLEEQILDNDDNILWALGIARRTMHLAKQEINGRGTISGEVE